MALTLSEVRRTKFNNLPVSIFKVTFDNSYPTGGESLAAADLGLKVVEFVLPAPASGYVFEYDYTNAKLKALYGDYSNASDGVLVEVPAATDLSSVSTYLMAVGL